jgi:sugar phosphate isomerase/epimerase
MIRRLRTTFALALGLAAAGTASARTASAQGGSPAFNFRGDFKGPLGVQLYSFRDAFKTDVPGTLTRIRALGFRDVELAGTYGMTAPQFKAALDRVGLRATSMHVGYEQLRDSTAAMLAQAKALGVRYVGTAWIPHSGPFTAESARKAAADFNRIGKAAQAQGLQFFYHIHGYEFQPGADGVLPMDVLMTETDPNAVKYEMDVFWITRPGADPVAWLKKYPNRWKLLHLKDMKQGVATNVHTGSAPPDSSEVPLGSGKIDYKAVLRTAKQVGVDQFFIEDETKEPFSTVPVSVRWAENVKY